MLSEACLEIEMILKLRLQKHACTFIDLNGYSPMWLIFSIYSYLFWRILMFYHECNKAEFFLYLSILHIRGKVMATNYRSQITSNYLKQPFQFSL